MGYEEDMPNLSFTIDAIRNVSWKCDRYVAGVISIEDLINKMIEILIVPELKAC